MATLYKNNIPYSNDNSAVQDWAEAQSAGAISSGAITKVRPGHWSLVVNSAEIRTFAGAPSAMTALYELYVEGGGGDFGAFSVTVTPAVDMSDIDVTDGVLTITGHSWEDYSGSPSVVGLRSDNTETFRTAVTGTDTVSVPAATERLLIGTAGAVPIFETLTVVPAYTFSPDRRPMYVQGFGTNTQKDDEISWGMPREDYRTTPITSNTAGFTDPNQNGRLKWIQNDPTIVANRGIERFQIINPAGWTSVAASSSYSGTEYAGFDGNFQPHYPSNFYTGMSLSSAPLYASQDSTIGSKTLNTPYTVSGYAAGDTTRTGQGDNTTQGDSALAWAAAVADLKATIGPNAEVCAYGGYRPCWDSAQENNLIKTQLGYSKPSTSSTAGWTGTGNSPGWTPEPGYDGVNGKANSTATFRAWFDEEVAGLRDVCGFDTIGLDTGARAWDHAAGMANDNLGNAAIDYADGRPGNDRIIEVFNDYGMKPYLESVALDRWTYMTSYDRDKLAPMTGADGVFYTKCATWAFLGSWWGYIDDANNVDKYRRIGNVGPSGWSVSGGSVWNPTDTDGGASLGDPTLNGGTGFSLNPATTEVHCVVRWDDGAVNSMLALTDGWDIFRKMLYDFNDVGIIISTYGNTSNSISSTSGGSAVTVTAQMFWDYVLGLYNGTAVRPGTTPTETSRLVVERAENSAIDMVGTSNGDIRANSSYTTLTTTTGNTPVTNSQYPRVRHTNPQATVDIICDIDFVSSADRDAFLAACDTSKLKCRLTVTSGSSIINQGTSLSYDISGSTNTNQIRFVINHTEWTTGSAPLKGFDATNWIGKDSAVPNDGWLLTSGIKMEVFES